MRRMMELAVITSLAASVIFAGEVTGRVKYIGKPPKAKKTPYGC